MKMIRGFSLVEVLCAILILGFGLVGLTQGVTTALQSSREAEIQTTAALLAAGQIETLRAEGFVIAGETEGEGEGELANYSWTQTVRESSIEGLFEVSVAVRRAQETEPVFELATLIFDPPRETEAAATEQERQRKNESRREP